MQLDQALHTITIAALPVLFAITLHEAAHGYVARYFGDMTAARKGRISLNPLRHIDPIGTVMLPMLTLWLGGVIFGWAKPVPVNFGALRRPKQDMLWVALAGPASNLLMALAWALLAKFALTMQDNYFAKPMWAMANYGIMINAVLIALNMLPLPPLDGGRVVVSLLPRSLAIAFSKIEPYGMFILIFMAVMTVGNSSLLGMVLLPTANALIHAIALLFGFNFTQ